MYKRFQYITLFSIVIITLVVSLLLPTSALADDTPPPANPSQVVVPSDAGATGAPTNAAVVQPASTDIASTKAAPTDVVATQPASTNAASTDAAAVQPASTEVASTNAAPADVVATQPASTNAAPTDAAATQPAPTDIAPTDTVATQPASTEVASTNPAPADAAATQPTPTDVAPTDATPANVATQPGISVPATVTSIDDSTQLAATQIPSTDVSDSTASANEASAVAALANSGSVLTDQNGKAIPLAFQQAADILGTGDPYIIRGGITYHFSTIQAAIDFANSGEMIYVEPGTYGEDVAISNTLVMTGLGSGANTNSFTLNSGADVTGSSNIFAPLVNVNSGAKIQNGIDLAAPGGTLNVAAGTYHESLLISKPLTLQSTTGASSTIINGGDPYSVFISSKDVTVDGFTITNPGYTGASDASGIVVEPLPYGPNADIRITNNIIHDIGAPSRTHVAFGTVGINVGAANGVEIDHNEIYNIVHRDPTAWANGISIWGGGSTTPSDNITIHDNSFHDIFSPYSADAAISTQTDVGSVTVYNNSIFNMDEYGIEVRSTNIVSALHNWWGDAGGPLDTSAVPDACGLFQTNPSGAGSRVSQCVLYDPWLTTDPFASSGGHGGSGSGELGTPILPITGGQLTTIDCGSPTTIVKVDGIEVTFSGLCGYEVELEPVIAADLPGALSQNLKFVTGIAITLVKDGKAVDALPAGTSIQVSYLKPSGSASIMAWNGSSWVEKPISMRGDRAIANLDKPVVTTVLVTH